MAALGATGWLLANYGPIATALLIWRWSQRMRRSWILHVLLLPIIFAEMRVGGDMMLHVMDQPDFDAMMGAPIIPGTALVVVALLGYLAALISRQMSAAGEPREAP